LHTKIIPGRLFNGKHQLRTLLRQVLNGITVDGVSADIDHAVAADFGQWGY
jgi:hypothetical protein